MVSRGIYFILLWVQFSNAFRVQTHPLEKRIAYITELPSINIITSNQLDHLKQLHAIYPLLIIKNQNNLQPQEFVNFVKEFDDQHDIEALKNPENHPHQMLQPFDQFPECPHVAPRGNTKIHNFRGIPELNLKPSEVFIDKYVWHVDLLGHETKLPNVITGFNIITQPLVGGDTDFISGETIYENLSEMQQYACKNMLLQINRKMFAEGKIQTSYTGCQRTDTNIEEKEGRTLVPLVYAPSLNAHPFQKPSVLLLPSFFVKVEGWNYEDSRKWMGKFMRNHVLPHRVSVQWKKGDLAIMNNRRFIHSSTPARNYMNSVDGNQRLLLQTFIPTRAPLYAFQPFRNKSFAAHYVKWIHDDNISHSSTDIHREFVNQKQKKYGYIPCDPKHYVLSALPL